MRQTLCCDMRTWPFRLAAGPTHILRYCSPRGPVNNRMISVWPLRRAQSNAVHPSTSLMAESALCCKRESLPLLLPLSRRVHQSSEPLLPVRRVVFARCSINI